MHKAEKMKKAFPVRTVDDDGQKGFLTSDVAPESERPDLEKQKDDDILPKNGSTAKEDRVTKILPGSAYENDGTFYFVSERMERNVQCVQSAINTMFPRGEDTGLRGLFKVLI